MDCTNNGPNCVGKTTTLLALGIAACYLLLLTSGQTQDRALAQESSKVSSIVGLSRQPSPAARSALLDPSDTVMLLLDHQTGLFQTVKDVPVAELRNNTVALASIAKLGKAPIIYTASVPDEPNAPLMDELDAFKDSAQYVPRK